MEKIFKLEYKPMPKGLYIFTGIIFIINGGIILYSNNLKLLSIIVGVLMILAGLGYLFLSPFKYSQKSKFFPRVKINEVSIWAKTGFWSRPVIVRWEDIREIDLDSYRINFKLKKIQPKLPLQLYPRNFRCPENGNTGRGRFKRDNC